MKKLFALLLLPVLLAGCANITNLAPSKYPRETTGYYRVEAQWYSDRAAIREGSFKPLVVVDGVNTYPMRPVPLVNDRWEAYIPVPSDRDMVLYHFKFDYEDNTVHGPRANSLMSKEYELHVK